jgi:hypothetical protein
LFGLLFLYHLRNFNKTLQDWLVGLELVYKSHISRLNDIWLSYCPRIKRWFLCCQLHQFFWITLQKLLVQFHQNFRGIINTMSSCAIYQHFSVHWFLSILAFNDFNFIICPDYSCYTTYAISMNTCNYGIDPRAYYICFRLNDFCPSYGYHEETHVATDGPCYTVSACMFHKLTMIQWMPIELQIIQGWFQGLKTCAHIEKI